MFYSPNVVVAVAKESHDSFCYVQVTATLRGVWFEELKFNKYCSTFVLFDKKFPI
jgi:hypothetical protein